MPYPTFRDSVIEVLSAEAKANRWSIEKRELIERVVSLRRAETQRLPVNHRDVTAKILLRQEDAGRIQLQNQGGLIIIVLTETGARFFQQWTKPASGAQLGPWPAKREALARYRASAELLISIRDALGTQPCADSRLWDAEMLPVVIRERINSINDIHDGITELQNNLEHVHKRLDSAERRLAEFGYRVDDDGNVVTLI